MCERGSAFKSRSLQQRVTQELSRLEAGWQKLRRGDCLFSAAAVLVVTSGVSASCCLSLVK